jgi:hypothetical protein
MLEERTSSTSAARAFSPSSSPAVYDQRPGWFHSLYRNGVHRVGRGGLLLEARSTRPHVLPQRTDGVAAHRLAARRVGHDGLFLVEGRNAGRITIVGTIHEQACEVFRLQSPSLSESPFALSLRCSLVSRVGPVARKWHCGTGTRPLRAPSSLGGAGRRALRRCGR